LILYIILIKIILLSLMGCINDKPSIQYTRNSLIIQKLDTIYNNQQTHVQLYFARNEFKIKNAYVDCDKSDRIVDPEKLDIISCEKKLMISDDTVEIYFTPTLIGKKEFDNITLLYEDYENNIYLLDTTFSYYVSNERE